MRSLITELKRRSVFKVAIAYAVVAWAVMQIADVTFGPLQLPEWAGTLVIFLVILGFPFALVIAWAYELTPQGIKRESELSPDVPPRPRSELAAVAVLPFKNLMASSDEGYMLAEALPLELHASLSRVHRLRVVSAQSSLAHSQADKDLQRVAQELDVKYVICGSIAQSGATIRVIAELFDAVSDSLLWSSHFDMKAEQVFDIEQRIAEAVAMAFGGERLRLEMEQARSSAATDLAAWELVQKARGYLLNYTADAVAAALPMLEQAVALDPNYAVGYAQLGLVTAEKTINAIGDDPDRDRATAMEAIVRAESLAPSDPVVLRSAGAVHAYCGQNLQAIELLKRAVALAPYDLGTWGYLGWPLVATGQAEHLRELHEVLDRLLATGPKHPGYPYWLFHKSVAYCCEGHPDKSLELAQRSTATQPRFALGWMHSANVLGQLERSDAAKAAARRSADSNPRISADYYAALMAALSDNAAVIESRTAGLRQAGLMGQDTV